MSVQKFCVTTWRTERQQGKKNTKHCTKCLSCLDYSSAYLSLRVCVCVVRSSASVCVCVPIYYTKIGLSVPPCFQCCVCSPCSVHGQLHCCVAQQCSANNNNITYHEHKDETQAQQCCYCWWGWCCCCFAPLLLPNMAAHELKLNLKQATLLSMNVCQRFDPKLYREIK